MLTELSKGTKVVGAKQTKRAIADGRAKVVFLAQNADPAITSAVEGLSQSAGITVHWVEHMHTLGQACGIAVGAAVAAQVE